MTEDLSALLERLKTMGQQADDEIMAAVRAFGVEAIEPLMAMAVDRSLHLARSDSLEVWAPIHAIQLLADLPITEAQVAQLYALLDQYLEDDWLFETMADALPRAGAVVIGPILAALRDEQKHLYVRNNAAVVLEKTAKQHPDLRERIADGLVAVLTAKEPAEETDDDITLNAFVLGALGETQVDRHLPLVQRMFVQGRVDETITDLHWVRDTLKGRDPRARYRLEPRMVVYSDLGTYQTTKRPGRNEPCWCGSGKKYKHCHLRSDQEEDGSMTR